MQAPSPSRRVLLDIGFGVVAVLLSTTASAGVGVWTTTGPSQGAYFVIADQQNPGVLYASAMSPSQFESVPPYKSTDDGSSWSAIGDRVCQAQIVTPLATSPPSTVYFSHGSNVGPGVFLASVFASTDGGASCTGLPLESEPFSTYSLAVDAVNRRELFASVSGGVPLAVSRSVDGGTTWTRIDSNLELGAAYDGSVVTDPKISGTLYLVTAHALFKSVDSGAAWVSLATATGQIAVVAVDPASSSVVYMGGTPGLLQGVSGSVVKSIDGGTTFTEAGPGLPDAPVTALCVNPRNPAQVFAATGEGVFTSLDGGASWRAMNAGLPYPFVDSLAIDPTGEYIHAGTPTGVFDFQLTAPTCAKDPHTLCLNGGRFAVAASFREVFGALPVRATAVALTNDTGYFWFFDPANVEMVVKVLTGCSINDEYWVFAGGLTNVGVEWIVTDTLSGAYKTYSNALGSPFQPVQDSSAFPCP